MKKIYFFLIMSLLAFSSASFAEPIPFVLFPNTLGDAEHPDLGTERAIFKVALMADLGDKEKIETKIWKLKGIRSVTFKMKERVAEIVFQSKDSNSKKLMKAFKDAGFSVSKVN